MEETVKAVEPKSRVKLRRLPLRENRCPVQLPLAEPSEVLGPENWAAVVQLANDATKTVRDALEKFYSGISCFEDRIRTLQKKVADLAEKQLNEETNYKRLKEENRRKDEHIAALHKRVKRLDLYNDVYTRRLKTRYAFRSKWICDTQKKIIQVENASNLKLNRKAKNESKPESPKITLQKRQSACKDQEIQTEPENHELLRQIAEKDERIKELQEKIRQEIRAENAAVEKNRVVVLKKEAEHLADDVSIAAEALSSLNQPVIHTRSVHRTECENHVSTRPHKRISECEMVLENGAHDEPRQKFKKLQRPQKRQVKQAYFRWTTDRNVQLISAMIEVLAEHGDEQLKESEFLGMVWERCGKISNANKIRDNVNNLLRRHMTRTKGNVKSIPEVKSYPAEYRKLLMAIRDSLTTPRVETEKIGV